MTIEVELHSSDPSAVEATRATVTQAPISAELLEKGGRFFLRGSYFALDACVVQGYVKRRIGNAFDEREVSIGEALQMRPVTDTDYADAAKFMMDNNPAIFGPDPNPAITLRPHPGHQERMLSDGFAFGEPSPPQWPRRDPGLPPAARERLLHGTWKLSPEPSPGPWTVKDAWEPTMRGGRERVFLVIDASGKTVASCDDRHQVDAYFIAGARDPDPASAALNRARAFVNGFWGMVEKVPGGRGEALVEKLAELLGGSK